MKSVKNKNISIKEHFEEKKIENLPLFKYIFVSKSTSQKEKETKIETLKNVPKETATHCPNQIKDQSEILNLSVKFIDAKEYWSMINLFKNLNQLEVKPLYEFLKSEVLEKEIFPLGTRKLSKLLNYEIYVKTLLFLFILKKYNFRWPFDEKETAKLISFIFFYNIKKNNSFTSALKPLKFILTPSPEDEVKSIKLDLPNLSPSNIIENIPLMVFDFIFRSSNDFAFPVIYLLFMKDNEEFKKAFFTKLAMKTLIKDFSHKYAHITEKLRTIDKYKDYIFVFDKKVTKMIESFLIEEVKEKAKNLVLLIGSPEFSDMVYCKEELEKVKHLIEKTANLTHENSSVNYYFQFQDIEGEYWNETKILFEIEDPIYWENSRTLRKKIKELGEEINKEMIHILQDPKEINQITNKYISIVTAFTLIREFLHKSKERISMYSFSHLLELLDKITQKKYEIKPIYEMVERIKEELFRIKKLDLPSLIGNFLQFKRKVLDMEDISELLKLFINETTNYLLSSIIYDSFKKAVIEDLDKETLEAISIEKYSPFVGARLQKSLEKLNLNDFDQFKKFVKVYFDETRRTGRIANFFLLKDIVKFSKNKELHYSYIKKEIKKETYFLGYLYFIEKIELNSDYLHSTKKARSEDDLSREKISNLIKKAILLLNLANLLKEHSQYKPFSLFYFLFKESRFREKQEPIILEETRVGDVFYANLFHLLLPEYVNDYVIYL